MDYLAVVTAKQAGGNQLAQRVHSLTIVQKVSCLYNKLWFVHDLYLQLAVSRSHSRLAGVCHQATLEADTEQQQSCLFIRPQSLTSTGIVTLVIIARWG